jgi:hypothetical protein
MARRAPYSNLRIWTLALALAAAMIGGQAGAEDYPECAKFDNPLAYNQCLAMHGPAAHGTKGIAPPIEGRRPPMEGQRKSAASSWRNLPGATAIISRTRSGKMIMEFSVNEPAKASGAHKRSFRH